MKVGRRGDVDKPGARRDGHRSSLKRLRLYVHAYHGRRAEELAVELLERAQRVRQKGAGVARRADDRDARRRRSKASRE